MPNFELVDSGVRLRGRRLIGIVALVIAIQVTAPPTATPGVKNQSQMSNAPHLLTSELVKKFLITQDALRKIELSRPPTGRRWVHDDVTLARLLEEDVETRRVFSDIEWTALDYAKTQSAIVETLMALDDVDSGHTKRLPDDVSEANAQFLRKLPDDVSEEFARWKRVNIDPALRELREMARGQ